MLVSRQIRDETKPLYYSTNTFAFSLSCTAAKTAYDINLNVSNQVDKWQNCVLATLPNPGVYVHWRPAGLWTVRLECQMLPLTRTGVLPSDAEILQPATIDMRVRGDDKDMALELSFTGQLAEECTCDLRLEARDVVLSVGEKSVIIAAFADVVENRWKANWAHRNRRAACPMCRACGKICGDDAVLPAAV